MARKPKIVWDKPTQDWMIAVGQNLRVQRQSKEKTLVELAAAVGLSHPSLSLIERGEQEFLASYFHRFAKALDIPISELIPSQPELMSTPEQTYI